MYYAKEILQTPEKGDNFDPTKATVVEVEEISMQNVCSNITFTVKYNANSLVT